MKPLSTDFRYNDSMDPIENLMMYKIYTIEIFKPKTPLEIETAKLLQGSKYNLSNKVELTAAEEETLKAMSLAEVSRNA